MVNKVKLFDKRIMLVGNGFPTWGKSVYRYNHNYILTTSKWFKAKCINLNFIRNMQVDSIEKYNGYLAYFLKSETKESWQKVLGRGQSIFKIEVKSEYNQDTLSELFETYYSLDVLKQADNYIELKVNVTLPQNEIIKDEVQNICPDDFRKFIKDITGIEVSISQRGKVRDNKKKQLIYRYNDKIFLLRADDNDSRMQEIATVSDYETEPNKLIILCDDDFEWKNAICRVLEHIKNDKDIVEKCKAYLPNNQCYAIQGTEYNDVTNKEFIGNMYYRRMESNVINSSKMNCADIKQIITARGNNDKRCCCCGSKLVQDHLIIVQNACDDTNEEYANVVNVVCKECNELLQKSHKETYVYKKEDGYYVEHICTVQNTHQTKNIVLSYRVCDGVRLLWKKE